MTEPPVTLPVGMRVLLIDDHALLRGIVARDLARWLPADVTQAGSIDEALALSATQQFDVIVSDVNLGRESSIDNVLEIKSGYPHARLVLVSGASPADTGPRALKAGADGFVSKSAGIERLCEEIVPGWAAPPGVVTYSSGW